MMYAMSGLYRKISPSRSNRSTSSNFLRPANRSLSCSRDYLPETFLQFRHDGIRLWRVELDHFGDLWRIGRHGRAGRRVAAAATNPKHRIRLIVRISL